MLGIPVQAGYMYMRKPIPWQTTRIYSYTSLASAYIKIIPMVW